MFRHDKHSERHGERREELWVSTVLLSTRNVDEVYSRLKAGLRQAGLDADKLYAPGILRSYLHDTLAYTWYKSAGAVRGPMGGAVSDPRRLVDLLNKVTLRQVTAAVEKQHREVVQVGLSGFPASYLAACKSEGKILQTQAPGGATPIRLLGAQKQGRCTNLKSLSVSVSEKDARVVEDGGTGSGPYDSPEPDKKKRKIASARKTVKDSSKAISQTEPEVKEQEGKVLPVPPVKEEPVIDSTDVKADTPGIYDGGAEESCSGPENEDKKCSENTDTEPGRDEIVKSLDFSPEQRQRPPSAIFRAIDPD